MPANKPAAATTGHPANIVANCAKLTPAQVATLFGMATTHGLFADTPTPTNGKALAALLTSQRTIAAFMRAIKGAQGGPQMAALAALYGKGTTPAPKPTANAGGQGRKYPNDWVLLSINCNGNPKSGASAPRFDIYRKLGVGATLGALKQAGMLSADFGWDTKPTRNFVTLGPASALQAVAKPAKGRKVASNGVTLATSASPQPDAPQPAADAAQ